MIPLSFHNTLTGKKEPFEPLTPGKVGMYVCGPTVYNRPHIGNARSVVIYDVLFRLLRHVYGERNVTYVRNITDVDDKINAAAIERNISIQALTAEVTAQFHDDMAALNCLPPDIEPRATTHIAEMIAMIERLIANGNAYESGGHVLFDVGASREGRGASEALSRSSSHAPRPWYYGMLSGRSVEDQEAGARIAVESYKKHPGDFVLWKPADAQDDVSSTFESPWGLGRPGWHIECSAMSTKYLGETFDIHGGGADLKFPHHENEIAQSCCANPGSEFARTWVHNGFLTVNGEKMSKSLGNFVTVKELLDKGVKGEVIRLALLSAKYNEPLDWNDKAVADAKKLLHDLYMIKAEITRLGNGNYSEHACLPLTTDPQRQDYDATMAELVGLLSSDINTPAFISKLRELSKRVNPKSSHFVGLEESRGLIAAFEECCELLGIVRLSYDEYTGLDKITEEFRQKIDSHIDDLVIARTAAKKSKDFATADRIRDELKEQGIVLEDRPDGTTDWRRG